MHRVCLNDGHDSAETWPSLCVDIPQDALFPRARGDGLMEVEVGEFHNGEGDDGEVSINPYGDVSRETWPYCPRRRW